jgi:RHS repeat-associated protein
MEWERNTDAAPKNAYGYNGKELDTDLGLNMHFYGARFYDPAIARWNSLDPHAESYASQSPYNYVANMPTGFIDPTGKDLVFYLNDNDENNRNQAFQTLYDVLSRTLDGGNFTLSATKDGGFKLGLGELAEGASDYAVAGHYYLSRIVNDESTTEIGVSYSNKDIQIGSYDNEIIDIADINAYPNNKGWGNNTIGTSSGKLIHELTEQYTKQKNNLPNINSGTRSGFNTAHADGLTAEAGVDMLQRVKLKRGQEYIYPDFAKRIPRNSTGRRTVYRNHATGQEYIEAAMFEDQRTGKKLGTLSVTSGKKK